MSETKWTPGPWTVHDHSRDEGVLYVEARSDGVASVFTYDPPDERDRANARLIAHAPDLYDALNALRGEAGALLFEEDGIRSLVGLTNMSCFKRRLAEADASLAKARGGA
jgi:hypothetical protein